jgi:hypothetical protein
MRSDLRRMCRARVAPRTICSASLQGRSAANVGAIASRAAGASAHGREGDLEADVASGTSGGPVENVSGKLVNPPHRVALGIGVDDGVAPQRTHDTVDWHSFFRREVVLAAGRVASDADNGGGSRMTSSPPTGCGGRSGK